METVSNEMRRAVRAAIMRAERQAVPVSEYDACVAPLLVFVRRLRRAFT